MSAAPMPLAQSAALVPAPQVMATKIIVRGLSLQAEIGVHDHERGRRQALIADVELDVVGCAGPALEDTIDYESIVQHAHGIIAQGHVLLVEEFATRLANACLGDPRVRRAKVRVEKPEALAPHAAAAGVEIVLAQAEMA